MLFSGFTLLQNEASTGRALFEKTPDASGEGRDRLMTLVEVLTLISVIVSLLALIVTIVHVTFDITFRMSELRKENSDKKEK